MGSQFFSGTPAKEAAPRGPPQKTLGGGGPGPVGLSLKEGILAVGIREVGGPMLDPAMPTLCSLHPR